MRNFSPSPNIQAGVPPPVGCHPSLIQYIISATLHVWGAVSSIICKLSWWQGELFDKGQLSAPCSWCNWRCWMYWCISCLWFRVSLIYINNYPTRCNTKQSIYYSASSLYIFRVSTTPIIRGTQNCNYSLRYWSYFLCSYLPPTWPSLATLGGGSCTVPEVVVTVLCTGHIFVQLPLSNVAKLGHVGGR